MQTQDLVRIARARAGLTQAQLASRSGRPRETIARWETGRQEPSLSALRELVDAAGLELVIRLAEADDSLRDRVREQLDRPPLQRLAALLPADVNRDTLRALEPEVIVRGERAALGPLRADLAPQYARWSNDPEVRRGLLRRGVATPETELAWVEGEMRAGAEKRPASVHFTVYDAADLAPVGSCGLFEIDHLMGRARLGILLGERRGQGIGTDAVRLLLRWGFGDLGLHNVMLEAWAWNESAQRAYERAGFRLVGRRRGSLVYEGQRYDEVIMDAVASDVLT